MGPNGDDPQKWFEKGREHLTQVFKAVEAERDEVESMGARIQALEEAQRELHSKFEAAVKENGALRQRLKQVGSGGASGGGGAQLRSATGLAVRILELLVMVAVVLAPLAVFSPEAFGLPVAATRGFVLPPATSPPKAVQPAAATMEEPPPPPSPLSPSPPLPPACADDPGDGTGVLVKGSDCDSYKLFPGCDHDLHELFDGALYGEEFKGVTVGQICPISCNKCPTAEAAGNAADGAAATAPAAAAAAAAAAGGSPGEDAAAAAVAAAAAGAGAGAGAGEKSDL